MLFLIPVFTGMTGMNGVVLPAALFVFPAPIIYTIPEPRKTAIIGLGSDDAHKSEILPYLFSEADAVIVDSKQQAAKFGDISRALKEDIITQDALIELGAVLKSGVCEHTKTIIADFSGMGAQDVAITECVLSTLVAH
jgi:ornithine cyclodeaminase